MTYTIANELLDRYFAGETSLAEERALRNYFLSGDVHPELARYAPLFAYWDAGSRIKAPTAKRRRLPLRWLTTAAAAVLLLLAANGWFHQQPEISNFPIAEAKAVDWSKYEVTDEREAYLILRAALKTASTQLNRGPKMTMKELQAIGEVLH